MKVYAYKNIPDIVKRSSSGGAFTKVAAVFAEKYSDSFSIYGATWTKNNDVVHTRVTRIEDIDCFNGSKYVRSNIKNIYLSVEKDLLNGMAVLFSGTPCQISGLIRYLGMKKISAEKLLTIDIVCHGTPNPQILMDFVSWLERKYKSSVTNITFRDKNVGWKRYPTKILFANGRVLRQAYDAQLYIRMYFSLLILDKRCYSCKFSNMERVSDITLGDFWGVDKIIPEISTGKGVSLIIVNSENGEKVINIIKKIQSSGEILKEYQGDEFLNFQHNLNSPTEKPSIYEDFWIDYKEYGFDYVVEKYKFDTIKGRIKFLVKSALIRFDYFDKRLS